MSCQASSGDVLDRRSPRTDGLQKSPEVKIGSLAIVLLLVTNVSVAAGKVADGMSVLVESNPRQRPQGCDRQRQP